MQKNDCLNLIQRIQKPFLDKLSNRINRSVTSYLDKDFKPGLFAVSILNAADSCGTQLMKVIPIGQYGHLNQFVDQLEMWKNSVKLLRKSYLRNKISKSEFANSLTGIQLQILTFFKVEIPINNAIAA